MIIPGETTIAETSVNEEFKRMSAFRANILKKREEAKLEAKKIVNRIIDGICDKINISTLDITYDKYVAKIDNYDTDYTDVNHPETCMAIILYTFDEHDKEELKEVSSDSCKKFDFNDSIGISVWKEMLVMFEDLKIQCMCSKDDSKFYIIFNINDFSETSEDNLNKSE